MLKQVDVLTLALGEESRNIAPHANQMFACIAAVARIGLVKPEKAKGVENMVLQMAQRGQLTEKVRALVRKLMEQGCEDY